MDIAISADKLGKRYKVSRVRQRSDRLTYWVSNALSSSIAKTKLKVLRNGLSSPSQEFFWAVKNVSFELRHGEVLGFIGRNGAGKSTLLKILSRITEPTEGEAHVYGRVGSLLEIGTGFHPDLTGRDNIYMNGAVLGMKRAEIRSRFDEIVEFSGVGKFVDTPVAHYSSGMAARLGFSVAAHLDPEILIVDEVLAVGDAEFQRKCLRKMGEIGKQGRTVMFVSHNLLAVEGLCTRVIWLDKGSVVEEGPPERVVQSYMQNTMVTETTRRWESKIDQDGLHEKLVFQTLSVYGSGRNVADPIMVGDAVVIELCLQLNDRLQSPRAEIDLYDKHDILLFQVASPEPVNSRIAVKSSGSVRLICRVPPNLLNDGIHRLSLSILNNGKPIVTETDALIFNVNDEARSERDGWYGTWPGAIRPKVEWTLDDCNTPLSMPS